MNKILEEQKRVDIRKQASSRASPRGVPRGVPLASSRASPGPSKPRARPLRTQRQIVKELNDEEKKEKAEIAKDKLRYNKSINDRGRRR